MVEVRKGNKKEKLFLNLHSHHHKTMMNPIAIGSYKEEVVT